MEDLFGALSSDEEGDNKQWAPTYEEREMSLAEGYPPVKVREFNFSPTNANCAWPSNGVMVPWLLEHRQLLDGKRAMDLGAGVGVLAIFLKQHLGLDICTSDYPDDDITENIKYNWQLNGLQPCLHIPHKWGEPFPFDVLECRDIDVVLANDILLYVAAYPALANTLYQVLAKKAGSLCIMSIGRNLGKDSEQLFLREVEEAGLVYELVGKRIYKIVPAQST